MAAIPRLIAAEKRSRPRFAIDLAAHYQIVSRYNHAEGSGRTIDISSRAISIACEEQVAKNTHLRVTVEWPYRLDGDVPIHLIVDGKVVRSDASSFTIIFAKHEFRTARRSAEPLKALKDSLLA